MSGVNKVILVGRLGKDPDVRHLESGASVANFPIATSEVYRDRVTGERREQTEWHNIAIWRGLADVAEKYLKKGDMVYIEGKLRTRSYEKEGTTRYITEIVGDNMVMLTPRSDGQTGGFSQQTSQPQQATSQPQQESQPQAVKGTTPAANAQDETDDLPF